MIRRVVVLIIFLCLGSMPGYGEERFPFIGEVSVNEVNIRAGQSANFEKLGRLQKGEKVVVLDKQYSWYKIRLPSTSEGYIHSKYIQILDAHRGVVTHSRVNIRALPNVDASSLGQAEKNTIVKIVGQKDDWFAIEPLPNLFGWISTEFLVRTKDSIPPLAALEKFHEPEKPASMDVAKISPASPMGFDPSTRTPAMAGGPSLGMEPNHKKSREQIPKGQEEDTTGMPVGFHLGSALTGQLEKAAEGVRYQLVVGEEARYDLEAPSEILRPFLNSQVKVQGPKSSNPLAPGAYPTISVQKIERLL